MDISYYKKYEPIFGDWRIVREIGEGGFGKVFEIERENYGKKYKAALKAITIPASNADIAAAMYDGMDRSSATEYFRGFVDELVGEIDFMSKLKGESNIVSYEDHCIIEHEDEIGWDVLIRMELLSPLPQYAYEHKLSKTTIVQLGIDICKALELCAQHRIIHRDIKPDNIFVSENGRFKLGDFGIARTAEKTSGEMSKKGTYPYMAPEVYRGEKYGASVDIYSLGLVLYRFLNENRTPFLPTETVPTYMQKEEAITRRISGETIPPPVNADRELAKVVLKACSYDPKNRYANPTEMRKALEAAASGVSVSEDEYCPAEKADAGDKTVGVFRNGTCVAAEPETEKKEDEYCPAEKADAGDKTVGVFRDGTYVAAETEAEKEEKRVYNEEADPTYEAYQTDTELHTQNTAKKKTRKKLIIPFVFAAVLLVGALLFFLRPFGEAGGRGLVAEGQITCTEYINDVEQDVGSTLEIDSKGRIISSYSSDESGDTTVSFEYNSFDLVTFIYKEEVREGKTSYIGTEENTYNGKLITEKRITNQWGDEEPFVEKVFYAYDSNDRLIRETHEEDGETNVYYYEYDDSGKLIRKDSNERYNYSCFIYDSEGRMIEEDYYYNEAFAGMYEYGYGTDDRLVEVIQSSVDAVDSRYTNYVYNDNGLLISVSKTDMFSDDVYKTEFSSGITMEMYELIKSHYW